MKKTNIKNVGFSGISIDLNLAELIVLKEFVAEAEKEIADNGKFSRNTTALLGKACIMIGKLLPENEDMLSLDDARKSLFEVKESEL